MIRECICAQAEHNDERSVIVSGDSAKNLRTTAERIIGSLIPKKSEYFD